MVKYIIVKKYDFDGDVVVKRNDRKYVLLVQFDTGWEAICADSPMDCDHYDSRAMANTIVNNIIKNDGIYQVEEIFIIKN